MDISVRKDLGALRGDALLRVDRSIWRARQRLDVNADIHAAKLAEARLLTSVGASNRPTPLLTRESEAAGTSLAALAEAVIAKAAAAADRVADLEVIRQSAQAEIRAAATPAAIDAIASKVESQECL